MIRYVLMSKEAGDSQWTLYTLGTFTTAEAALKFAQKWVNQWNKPIKVKIGSLTIPRAGRKLSPDRTTKTSGRRTGRQYPIYV